MALLYSNALLHVTSGPFTPNNHNLSNKLNNLSKKNNLHFARKTSTTTFSVKCLKSDVPTTGDQADEQAVINTRLSPTLLPKLDFSREDFPPDFLFGASTSALQTEGKWNEGGRGKCIWDDTLLGGNAVDSYHRYKDDVKLLKEMGMSAYRFSIAWPRIFPNGTIDSGVNQEGVDFYNKLIDELLKNEITPIVTLLHFDLPQAIQDNYKGFLGPDVIEHFKQYADFCFKTFGDRVKIWGTINEPIIFIYYGKKMGFPPELKTEHNAPLIASHHIILAHAAAAKLYQQKYKESQGGKIGISLPIDWSMPYDPNSPNDLAAANATLDLQIGWYMNPLVYGDYPEWMKQNIKELPEFSQKEKEMVKGAFDFIGINYYTSRFIEQTFDYDMFHGKVSTILQSRIKDVYGNGLGVQAAGREDIFDYPDGLRQLLVHIKNNYCNPELYITENGVSTKPVINDSIPNLIAAGNLEEVEQEIYDDARLVYVRGHLKAVHQALREGANVKGYVVWALMDNLEMGQEQPYDVRFGLNYVDYHNNYERKPKKSAKWFTRFLQPEGAKVANPPN